MNLDSSLVIEDQVDGLLCKCPGCTYAQAPANFPAKQRSLILLIYQHAWHSMVDI